MVCAMRFYMLVPRFFADPATHSATIQQGLPRTGRRRFFSVRRVRQKFWASVGGFWLDHVPPSFPRTTFLVALMSPFPLPRLPRYRQASLISSILRRSTFILRSCAGMLSLRFWSLSITSQKVLLTLISVPHHVVNSCTTSSKVCIPSGVDSLHSSPSAPASCCFCIPHACIHFCSSMLLSSVHHPDFMAHDVSASRNLDSELPLKISLPGLFTALDQFNRRNRAHWARVLIAFCTKNCSLRC